MTLPGYVVECRYCAQVHHVADRAAAADTLARHVLAGSDERCAYWPDHARLRLRARRTRRMARRRWILDDLIGPQDLGYCPHYRGVGICFQLGRCADPDVMEPLCETCEPVDGWPSTRYIALGELDYQPATIGRND